MRTTPWRVYVQIARSLRARFADAAPGSAVPSEVVLAAEFGVARNTVRRALAALEQDGVIMALPGRGRVVGVPGEGLSAGYRRIADDLLARIVSGELGPGDRVPSESELAARYGVSRATARRGLEAVQAAGLVAAVQGRGRFVDGSGHG
ncbi:MAG: GntR family transcriptional regulator [Pseudonocardia sp.]